MIVSVLSTAKDSIPSDKWKEAAYQSLGGRTGLDSLDVAALEAEDADGYWVGFKPAVLEKSLADLAIETLASATEGQIVSLLRWSSQDKLNVDTINSLRTRLLCKSELLQLEDILLALEHYPMTVFHLPRDMPSSTASQILAILVKTRKGRLLRHLQKLVLANSSITTEQIQLALSLTQSTLQELHFSDACSTLLPSPDNWHPLKLHCLTSLCVPSVQSFDFATATAILQAAPNIEELDCSNTRILCRQGDRVSFAQLLFTAGLLVNAAAPKLRCLKILDCNFSASDISQVTRKLVALEHLECGSTSSPIKTGSIVTPLLAKQSSGTPLRDLTLGGICTQELDELFLGWSAAKAPMALKLICLPALTISDALLPAMQHFAAQGVDLEFQINGGVTSSTTSEENLRQFFKLGLACKVCVGAFFPQIRPEHDLYAQQAFGLSGHIQSTDIQDAMYAAMTTRLSCPLQIKRLTLSGLNERGMEALQVLAEVMPHLVKLSLQDTAVSGKRGHTNLGTTLNPLTVQLANYIIRIIASLPSLEALQFTDNSGYLRMRVWETIRHVQPEGI